MIILSSYTWEEDIEESLQAVSDLGEPNAPPIQVVAHQR